MKAIEQYTNAIYEIQEATIQGKIQWIRNRPDSFTFRVMNEDLEDLILSFQKVESNVDEHFYLSLVKKDFENSEILLNIDTSNEGVELLSSLRELYNTIEYHVDLENLSGLNQFIDIVKHEKSKSTLFDLASDPIHKNGNGKHD